MKRRTGKTGSDGRPWIELDRPKPPKVADAETHWTAPPAQLSDACVYWVRQISRGWLPNRRIGAKGYYGAADWFGVYIWEYINVLYPLIESARQATRAVCDLRKRGT